MPRKRLDDVLETIFYKRAILAPNPVAVRFLPIFEVAGKAVTSPLGVEGGHNASVAGRPISVDVSQSIDVAARPLVNSAENQDVEKRLVRLSLKRMIGGVMAAVLALALCPSLAGAQTSTAAEAREKPRQGGIQATPQRNPREAKRPYTKRSGEAPRPQRMSPEERRQLRRDVKDAGREIYPPRR